MSSWRAERGPNLHKDVPGLACSRFCHAFRLMLSCVNRGKWKCRRREVGAAGPELAKMKLPVRPLLPGPLAYLIRLRVLVRSRQTSSDKLRILTTHDAYHSELASAQFDTSSGQY